MEGHEIRPKKVGQIWSNLVQIWVKNIFPSKSQTKWLKCMENYANNFFWIFSWLLLNQRKWNFQQQTKKFTGMIFHAFLPFFFTFWGLKFFDPNLDQVWPNLANFFGPNFMSFHHKLGFAKIDWFLKFGIFVSIGSKVIALGAPRPAKAIVLLTLWPLKSPTGEKVPRPMLNRPQVSVFTNSNPFWI